MKEVADEQTAVLPRPAVEFVGEGGDHSFGEEKDCIGDRVGTDRRHHAIERLDASEIAERKKHFGGLVQRCNAEFLRRLGEKKDEEMTISVDDHMEPHSAAANKKAVVSDKNEDHHDGVKIVKQRQQQHPLFHSELSSVLRFRSQNRIDDVEDVGTDDVVQE